MIKVRPEASAAGSARRSAPSLRPEASLPIRDRSPGEPLSAGVRAPLERSFGRSFAQIRIHRDEAAGRFAAGLGAAAFTRGRDVYFGAGRYEPGTHAGRLLIAHELAHTIQGRALTPDSVSRPEALEERSAALAAERAAAAGRVDSATLSRVDGSALQRQPAPVTPAPVTPAAVPAAPQQALADRRFPFPGMSKKTISDYIDEHVTAVAVNLWRGSSGLVYLTLDIAKDPLVVELNRFKPGTVDLLPFITDAPTLTEALAQVDDQYGLSFFEEAVRDGRMPCVFYRGPVGLLWPSWLNEQTMPRTTPYVRYLEAAGREEAGEIAKFFGDLLLWYVGARFPIRTKDPLGAAPAAATLAEDAKAAQQLAKEMAKKHRKVVVNLGGTGEVADAINVNPLKDQAVKGVPNLVKGTAEQVGTLFKSGSVDSIVSNNIVRGQLNWGPAAKGAFTALKSGGTISIAPYAGDIAPHLAEIQVALQGAGFKNITVAAGQIVTAVKP